MVFSSPNNHFAWYFNLGRLSRIKRLFVLRLNVPVNNILAMSGGSQRFQYSREFICLAQGHNTVEPVGIQPKIKRVLTAMRILTNLCLRIY